ncbi:hypothetical protein B0I31_12456 [Saccharothrix carnea]|uniref:Uncharacterized protein n=1 Tax=Saccharothrix carnea TaxID=1280637 RepID=A0A2P8HR25_SACCR|nr:hypothetical protein [Saccharothrix carnea]PSL48669.1 hypothetical protein B0I31_12456 [Saccharothrix carnea]
MTFHTQAELRQLGKDVADAARDAVLRERRLRMIVPDLEFKNPFESDGLFPDTDFYLDYPDLYESFATPDPKGMQRALNTLGSMSFALKHDFPALNPGGTEVPVPDISGGIGDLAGQDTPMQISENIDDKISSWHGSAKVAFQEKVLTKFEEKVDNQVVAVNLLAASLSMHMHLRQKLNEDIWNIGRKSIEAFDKVAKISAGDAVQIALLVGIAAGTAWTVWGGVAAGGLASLSAKDAASVVTGFNNIRMSPQVGKTISHDSPTKTDSDMKSVLGDAAKSYRDQEQEIVAAINHLSGGLRDSATNSLFVFPAPPEVDSLDEQGNNLPTLETEFSTSR